MRLTKYVVTELRELQAKRTELIFSLGTESVTTSSPKVGDWCAHRGVVCFGVLVDVASIGELALGGRIDAVDLAACQAPEFIHAKPLSYRVDAGMLEELFTGLVYGWQGGVWLKRTLARHFLGEVVAGV